MKTVKIAYTGMPEGFNPYGNLIYDQLKAHGYDVQITEDADFLICHFSDMDHLDFYGKPQVRIMYSNENFIPDLNLVDYIISPYPVQLGDRCFQLPPCVWPSERWFSLPKKDRNYTQEFVKNKPYFANFICSHESEHNIRGDFFKKLCEYKRVESAGTYLNNTGSTVSWLDGSKTELQRKCKFTLCFESTYQYGFVTEKIMDAFAADTIPIYYGSPTAAEIFNKDAFINAADYDSFDEVIEKIKELDQDDEKYLAMLRQPILVDPQKPQQLEEEFGRFICHIFDQPPEKAYRRSRVYYAKQMDDYMARAVDPDEISMGTLCKLMQKKIRRKAGSLFRRA